tara:strand:+ start:175 stop:336 length:162 start_codon:yes stop_codon:yes gene_type:complete
MSTDIREQLKAHYLNYFNNYISVEVWALDHNLNKEDGQKIIDLGRKLHEEDCR